MNSQSLLSSKKALAQANPLASLNGNGKSPIVHLRRCRHRTVCGKDFLYFDGVVSTSKISETTCTSCRRVHTTGLTLRRKARLYEKARSGELTLKQPAEIRPFGLVEMETAFQHAVEAAEVAAEAAEVAYLRKRCHA